MPMTQYGNVPSNIYTYLPVIEKYAKKYSVPVMVVVGTIAHESSGNPMAWNPSLGENSRGLMQISEKTALTHPAFLISAANLDSLYDPEINISYGVKYLAYIRDYLAPYFQRNIGPMERWLTITSSYNQGEGYYQKALIQLNQMGISQTWPNIKNSVLSLDKTPWQENVQTYGPTVLRGLDVSQLVSPAESVLAPLANTISWVGDLFTVNPSDPLTNGSSGLTSIIRGNKTVIIYATAALAAAAVAVYFMNRSPRVSNG